jgi:hypothetical protein
MRAANRNRACPISTSLAPIPAAAGIGAVSILEFKVRMRSGQPCDEWFFPRKSRPSRTDLYGNGEDHRGAAVVPYHAPLPLLAPKP